MTVPRLFPRLVPALAVLPFAVAALQAQLPVINEFSLLDPSPLPFGGQPSLAWDVAGATTVRLSPGIGPVPSVGTGTAAAPGLVTLVAAGDSWRYLDTGEDLGPSDQPVAPSAWFHPAFDDSAWAIGGAPLGYTNDNSSTATPTDQTRDLRYGVVPTDDPVHPNKLNDPTAKFPTTYFRKTFSVPASQLAELRALFVSLRRDDAAIAYLNGVEILRHNLPDGSVGSGTFSTGAAVGGNEFGTFFRVGVPLARLTAGVNTLAVEIHQANATSSDIIMDARVEAVISPGLQTLLPRGSVWRYLDDSSDAGVAWRMPGFADSAWPQGAGVLGYNNNTNNAAGTAAGANTQADFGTDPNAKPITTWFRKRFQVSDAASLTDFTLAANYDDGMIVFLNGVEIARAHMPAGEAGVDTLAITHEGDYALPVLVSGTDVVVADPATIAAALIEGPNLLAVQLHQSAANSSDASFNLSFTGTDGVTFRPLVKPFDRWAFLDTGEDLGTYSGEGTNSNAWVTVAFDDAGWRHGHGEIGYGDANDSRAPATSLDYGPDLTTKTLTAYFRRNILLANPAAFPSYTIELFRDDAAAVYVNGTEVHRDANLPADATFDARATSTANATSSIVVPASAFQAGSNLIAVEVHQESPTSSDLFFDLALHGNLPALTRTYTLTATNAAGTVTRDLTVAFASPPVSPVPLTTSLSGGVSPEPGWNSAAIWQDQLAPTPGKSYIVIGALSRVLATGEGAAHANFGGGSLVLGPRSILVHNGSDAAVATCAGLTLAGGEIQASHNAAAGVRQTRVLAGSLTVSAPSTLNPSGPNRFLEIAAALAGSATLTVAGNGAGVAEDLPSGVILSGDNSGFTGDWEVFSADLMTASLTALGGTATDPNTVHLRSGALLTPSVPLAAPFTDALLNNSNGTNPARLSLSQNLEFRTVTLVDVAMAPGTYSFASLTPEEQVHFVDGPGTLTIVGTPAGDSDGDGLDDAWELTHFGSLTQSGSDDPDGDGFANAAEFKIGTLPADGSSFYRFGGPTVVTVAGTPAVRLTFPSQAAWTLQPQWSPSLTTGQWQNLGPALTGATSHVVDDTGAATGGVPPLTAASPRRFYRVQLTVP